MTLGEFRRKTSHYSDSVEIVVEQFVDAENGNLGLFLEGDDLDKAMYDIADNIASVSSEPKNVAWKSVPFLNKNGDVKDAKQCVVIIMD